MDVFHWCVWTYICMVQWCCMLCHHSCLHYTYYSHACPGFTYVLSHIHTVVFKVVNYLYKVVKLFIAVSPCTTNYTWFYVYAVLPIHCHTCTVVFKVYSKCCLCLHSHALLTMHAHPGRPRVITQLDNIVQFDCQLCCYS